MRPPSAPRFLCGTAALLLAVALEAVAREDRFAVSATAAPHYHRGIPGREGLREESYVFMPGRFFGSMSRNFSLAAVPFETIARTVAPDLARQGYWPAVDPKQADLLVVVHWGITNSYEHEDPVGAMQRLDAAFADVAGADPGDQFRYHSALNMELMDREITARQQARSARQNARLLGYTATLEQATHGAFVTAEETDLMSELLEDRYFLVLMAYDYRAIREKKQKDVLWITRISVRSIGNNFFEALPALSRIGGDYFGQRQNELQRIRSTIGDMDTRRAIAEIGELKVIDRSPAPAEEKD